MGPTLRSGESLFPPLFPRILFLTSCRENADVNDYTKTNGTNKDRRWAEGSTLISRRLRNGSVRYYLTYSANNYEQEAYGVGYAFGDSPLGPFKKSNSNPILSEKQSYGVSIQSTGHGSIVASRSHDGGGALEVTHKTPQGSELFYVHHGRNNSKSDRSLYTTRLSLDVTAENAQDAMKMHLTAGDQDWPQMTSPVFIDTQNPGNGPPSEGGVTCSESNNITALVAVRASSGAFFDISEGSNRIVLRGTSSPAQSKREPAPVENHRGADIPPHSVVASQKDGQYKLTFTAQRTTSALQIVYQRQSIRGGWRDVADTAAHCL